MSLIESFNSYFDSILILWIGYLMSILFFYLYNYKYKFTYGGRKDATTVKIISVLNRIICVLPVAVTAAIRGMYTGADTYNYWHGYLRFENYSLVDAISYDFTGFFYNILKWLFVRLTNGNVQIFFFFFSFFTMYFVVLAIEAWKLKHGCMALFFFYCCFGPNLMNQMRQMLAVAILLYAYQFAYNKKYKKYFLFAVFAGLFHFSALLSAVIVCFLQKEKRNEFKEYLYYAMLIIAMLFMQHFLTLLGMFLEATKYGTLYLEDSTEADVAIGLGLLLSIIPNVIPVLIVQKKLDRENRFRDTIFMTLPIRLAGYYSYYVHRVMYYFCVNSIIALPLAVERTKKNKKFLKFMLYVLNITYFVAYYVIAQGKTYFPYTTYWGN